MQPRTDVQPTRDRDIGPEVENSHPSPAKGRRERERAELMAAPRRQTTTIGRPSARAAASNAPASRRASAALAACSPATVTRPAAQASPRAAAAGISHASTIDSNEPRPNSSSRAASMRSPSSAAAGRHELLDRVARDDGPWCAAGPTVGDRRCRAVGQGSCRSGCRPAVLDQEAHRPQALDRGVVVEPIARRRARRLDHAVAPLPCPRDRRGESRTRRGFLDRVHGLSNASTA